MDKHVFRKEILGLYKFFRKPKVSLPDEQTIDDWFDFLKKMPNNAFQKAIGMMKNKDSIPFNVPKAIKDSWAEYAASNPKEIIPDINNYQECSDCNSSGGFYVLLFSRYQKRMYQYLLPCGSCNNWMKLFKNPQLKRVTAERLIEKNIPFKPFNRAFPATWDKHGYTGRGVGSIFNGIRREVA